MRLCQFTSVGSHRLPVYVNPMQVLNITAYSDNGTTIYLAASKGDAVHSVVVVEPAEEVAGQISNQLATLKP